MDIMDIIAKDPIWNALVDAQTHLDANFAATKEKYASLKDSDPVLYRELMTRLEDEHEHITNGLSVRKNRRVMQLSENN